MTTTIPDFELRRFYTVSEAASLLGITRQALLKRINTGNLAAKKVGRSYVIESRHLAPRIPKVEDPDSEEQMHLRRYYDFVKRLHDRISTDPEAHRLYKQLVKKGD